jgi:hypothetical protein
MFMAIGFVLPYLTGQIPQIGNMMLPMHIPVLLCGLVCGWKYGLTVGFILPLMRSLLLGMPPLFPIATAMAFELAAYGFIIGFIYNRSRWQCIIALYRSLIIAMIAGRVVWGAAMTVLLGFGENTFTWQAFTAGALINAIPGIVVQLAIIPAIMVALNRTGLVKFRRAEPSKAEAAVNG